jgi:hypothetical protein
LRYDTRRTIAHALIEQGFSPLACRSLGKFEN